MWLIRLGVTYIDIITIKEASIKWGISERRIQMLCNDGRIDGAMKFGNTWAIPKDADKPIDARIKTGKYIKSVEK